MQAFPASKYSRYKRATAFFLDWLLRARRRGRHAGRKVKLEALSDVVQEIAADPSTLTPKLLQELPKALAACQCAVTLREHVASFFADDEYGHQHFLQLLKKWLEALKEVQVEQQPVAVQESVKFESYYAVLEVEEDYFPDEDPVGDRGASSKTKAERKRLFDEAFANNLRLEVVCYFMELEELVEGVFDIYDQVKKQERTMMEATVVGTLALKTANALTAKLQRCYPALETAADLLAVVSDHTSASLGTRITKAVSDARNRFEEDGTFKFVPGMLLHDFTNVWCTLTVFTSVFPPMEEGMGIGLPDGYFGESYGEERTPEYVFPDVNHYVVLLAQQMPMLYNMILVKRASMGRGYEGQSGLVVDFMQLMETYFETRTVTIPLVFMCICWMQSVGALQGDAGLSRTVTLTIEHSEDLITALKTTLARNPVLVRPTRGETIQDIEKDLMEGFEASLRSNNLARANPLFAGSQMMSNHLEYMIAVSACFTPICRAFCHLYNALVKQGFLERISFFDEMLKIYTEMIFSPSPRAAAVHGSYNRVYLLASRYTGSSIDALYDTPVPHGSTRRVKQLKGQKGLRDPISLSHIFQLMDHDDMSFLKGASSKAMLTKAADVCSEEMFKTRVLSRDFITLTDDINDCFSEMCDVLGRRQIHAGYMADSPSDQFLDYRDSHALENTVMLPLISLLDALQPDGSLDSSVVPTELRSVVEFSIDGKDVQHMCKKVAAVIKGRFATPPGISQQKYFTFPAQPDFANQVYGTVSFKVKTKNDNREHVFSTLMKLLKESRGPIAGKDLSYLKDQIKKDPELLCMISCSVGPRSENDLCTLLHQAAAGSAHDVKLVEWMIQLGALHTQPLHCRKEPRRRDLKCPRELLPNTMAVHSAAMAGHIYIARTLVEADNLVDLNTPTFHTKETLAHLAVKHECRGLYYGLQGLGADVRIRDGNGKRVCDVTTDPKWSREIAGIAATIEESCRRGRGRKDNSGVFRRIMELRFERLRKSVFAQRDEERQQVRSNPKVITGAKSKKMKKGKIAETFTTFSPSDSKVDTKTMPDLLASLIGAPDTANCSPKALERVNMLQASLQKTSAAFTRLRDPSTPGADKVDDAHRVCKVIQRLDDSTEVQADPNKMIGTGVQLRIDLSLEASQVIHMMLKFNRAEDTAIDHPELAFVQELCAATIDFVQFVVRTALISMSVERASQAREILDVLEKRLLKLPLDKREPSEFREMVQTYSVSRQGMGFGRTSTPDTFRRLEWYLSNTIKSTIQQTKLDKMAGRPLYFRLMTVTGTSDRQLSLFNAAMDSTLAFNGVARFIQGVECVIYGGTSRANVEKVHKLVLNLANEMDVKFDEQRSQPCTQSIRLGPFVFSAAGILRNAAAA